MEKKEQMVPKIRFPEFTDPWKQCRLGDVVTYISSNLTIKDVTEYGKYNVYDANNIIGKTNSIYVDEG